MEQPSKRCKCKVWTKAHLLLGALAFAEVEPALLALAGGLVQLLEPDLALQALLQALLLVLGLFVVR